MNCSRHIPPQIKLFDVGVVDVTAALFAESIQGDGSRTPPLLYWSLAFADEDRQNINANINIIKQTYIYIYISKYKVYIILT